VGEYDQQMKSAATVAITQQWTKPQSAEPVVPRQRRCEIDLGRRAGLAMMVDIDAAPPARILWTRAVQTDDVLRSRGGEMPLQNRFRQNDSATVLLRRSSNGRAQPAGLPVGAIYDLVAVRELGVTAVDINAVDE
jgi:hypothetical protein